MNPMMVDFYQLAFGGEDSEFIKSVCYKMQTRMEKKANNKGLGLNEDGTSPDSQYMQRRMTTLEIRGESVLEQGNESDDSDWGLEDPSTTATTIRT